MTYHADRVMTPDDLALAERLLPRIQNHFWVLTNGYVGDWQFGIEKPPPVPNTTMPWKRPDVRDLARRIIEFRERPQYVCELQTERARHRIDCAPWRSLCA